MLRISELKIKPDHTEKQLENEIRRQLKLGEREQIRYDIVRQSIDARKKPDLYYVYTIDVETAHEQTVLRRAKNKRVQSVQKHIYQFPYDNLFSSDRMVTRPVIAGSGPAGLFCALMLSRAGLRPIILERGEQVEDRQKTVAHFWATGELDPESNVQFGEGGAGTFSDGKLNTLVKDPDGKVTFVLNEFIHAGADPRVRYQQKPHIGTDVLVSVVKNIRNEILKNGGEFRFNTCLEKILPSKDGGSPAFHLLLRENTERISILQNVDAASNTAVISAGVPAGSVVELDTDHLILATGHSSRDTFRMLYDLGLSMQAKSFAVGFRMEHPQRWIDDAMYGEGCPYEMDAAPYKVTHKCENERGVYSFCMCPGGYVVNASSESGRLAVNGMSYSRRDGENANSAIVVTVSPDDYGSTGHPLDGLKFQEHLEEEAWRCGKGKIPIQRFEDFRENRTGTMEGIIKPQQKGLHEWANLRTILPEELNHSFIEGIEAFGRRIPGFSHPDALMSGVESRTSSPVRILRDDTCQSTIPGIFPCGEGAGYAGGITSAAVDGVRVAEAVCAVCANKQK